jgi:hypothetical protein
VADLIHLKAPSGLVIGMTEPLSAVIARQLADGELSRVNEDGSPWEGPAPKAKPAAAKPAAK